VSTASRTTRIGKALLSLVVLAVLALALHATVFSGASFTAGSADPGVVVTTGTLAHANDQSDALVIDAGGLVPGSGRTGTMTLQGSGDVPARYALLATGLADSPASPSLSAVLRLTVEDVTSGSVTLYQGTVSGFSSADLGSIAPGSARTYRLTVSYPAGANRADLQGSSTTLTLSVDGVTS
jgi:hypothetical protein